MSLDSATVKARCDAFLVAGFCTVSMWVADSLTPFDVARNASCRDSVIRSAGAGKLSVRLTVFSVAGCRCGVHAHARRTFQIYWPSTNRCDSGPAGDTLSSQVERLPSSEWNNVTNTSRVTSTETRNAAVHWTFLSTRNINCAFILNSTTNNT